MTFREAFAALCVCVTVVVVSRAEHPAYKIPYFLHEGATLANYTPEQLGELEDAFLKEKADKRGFKLVKKEGK
jgi:hypothetical protein